MNRQYLGTVLLIVVMAGCIGGDPEPRAPEADQVALPAATAAEAAKETPEVANPTLSSVPATQPVIEPRTVEPTVPIPAAPAVHPVPKQPEDDQWATEADLDGIRRKAAVGMGKKGRGYGNDVVTYPIATYFKLRERISINQIVHAMNQYQAMHGRYPRTQEEFRERIIKANGIALATLPDGTKFYYDPEKAELLVVRPQ